MWDQEGAAGALIPLLLQMNAQAQNMPFTLDERHTLENPKPVPEERPIWGAPARTQECNSLAFIRGI